MPLRATDFLFQDLDDFGGLELSTLALAGVNWMSKQKTDAFPTDPGILLFDFDRKHSMIIWLSRWLLLDDDGTQ